MLTVHPAGEAFQMLPNYREIGIIRREKFRFVRDGFFSYRQPLGYEGGRTVLPCNELCQSDCSKIVQIIKIVNLRNDKLSCILMSRIHVHVLHG